MSDVITRPFQKAEKFPATNPERMFSEAPPWLELVVTSWTWREWVLTKTLVNSGIKAPARVPQLMMLDSTHQSSPSDCVPTSALGRSRNQLAPKVIRMETMEVIHT